MTVFIVQFTCPVLGLLYHRSQQGILHLIEILAMISIACNILSIINLNNDQVSWLIAMLELLARDDST